LGRITANIILGAALAGFDEAVLTKGICSQCRYQQGEKLLINSMAVSRALLEGMGLGKFTISIKEKEKNKEAPLGRREIFSIISAKVNNKAASFLYHREKAMREKLTQSPENKSGKQLLPQRELLRELLEQNRPEKTMVVKYNPEFPWGKIKIEQNKCSACGTCAALCPMGAISKKIKDDTQLLYFNSSLCTNCSLCRAACLEHAIGFEDDFDLADIIAEEATVVGAIQLSTCIICGEIITAQKNNICPTCRKRQTWPMYVKV
jgi:ferredoxin